MTNPEDTLFPVLANRFNEIGIEQDDLEPEMWKLFFQPALAARSPLHQSLRLGHEDCQAVAAAGCVSSH